jgi:HSP20 family molecular chaperone IbpA
MDILTSIPVRVNGPELIQRVLENVKQRIAERAYENFVGRGSVHGQELDDWLNAERELIIKPVPLVRAQGEDIFVEMLLPEIDLPNLTVHVAPSQLVISSDPDEDGLQLCQVIDLPYEISLDGVDAEQQHNTLHVTAAVAQPEPEPA